MAQSKIQLYQNPAFKSFLGAMVGKDKNGADVTVLSMLARLDVDPWDEASDLARMQDVPARERLEALMAQFNDVPTKVLDRAKIARDLLTFLPGRPEAAASPLKSRSFTFNLPPFGAPIYWIILAFLFLGWIVMLGQAH